MGRRGTGKNSRPPLPRLPISILQTPPPLPISKSRTPVSPYFEITDHPPHLFFFQPPIPTLLNGIALSWLISVRNAGVLNLTWRPLFKLTMTSDHFCGIASYENHHVLIMHEVFPKRYRISICMRQLGVRAVYRRDISLKTPD